MTAPRCTCSVFANEPSRSCPKHGDQPPTLPPKSYPPSWIEVYGPKELGNALNRPRYLGTWQAEAVNAAHGKIVYVEKPPTRPSWLETIVRRLKETE